MNLLTNPAFIISNNSGIPDGWELFSPRDAIRPRITVSGEQVTLSGNGSVGVFGTLKQTVNGIKGNEGYRFGVDIRADEKVEDVHDTVRGILQWKSNNGNVLQTDYCWRFQPGEPCSLRSLTTSFYGTRLEQVFKAHQNAICVDVHLVFRWSAALSPGAHPS